MPRLRLAATLTAVAALAALPQSAPAAPHLPPQEKRALDRVFDRLVQTAVRRHDVTAAGDLVTPALRAATSRSEWDKGNLPVYPYNAAGRHQLWKPSFVGRDDVLFDVLLHAPNPRKVGAIAFTVEMRRIDGQWRVDSFVPRAMFAPAGKRPTIFA